MTRRLVVAVVATSACTGSHTAADSSGIPGAAHDLVAVPRESLCVTKGALARDAAIDVPTFRAVALGHAGDAAEIEVVVHGTPETTRSLASGQERRQLGLKLRAENGCNVVYVMWRLDPEPKLEVSVKRNPGARNHDECGAEGYTKIKPAHAWPLPALDDGAPHTLQAEIHGDSLVTWIDGRLSWQGVLPASAAELQGPAGVRSDNLAFELRRLAVDPTQGTAGKPPACHGEEHGD